MRSQLEVRELWSCSLFGWLATVRDRRLGRYPHCKDGPHLVLWIDVDLSTYHLRSTCFRGVAVAQLDKERMKENVTGHLPGTPGLADLSNHAQDVGSVRPMRPSSRGRCPAYSSRQRVRPARIQMAATAWIATVAHSSPWQQPAPAKQKRL